MRVRVVWRNRGSMVGVAWRGGVGGVRCANGGADGDGECDGDYHGPSFDTASWQQVPGRTMSAEGGVTADEEEVATPRRRQHQRRSTRAGLRRARAARRRVERWRNVVRAHKKQK